MPSADRKLRVFLCHASQDKPVVRELYQRLLAEGWIDPWLDEEKLLPGQDWDMEIEKAVESADAVIVCLSNNSVTKEGYVQRELKFAYEIALEKPEGTIFVIPFRLDDCIVPRRLREWHYINYFPDWYLDSAYKRLLESLEIRAKEKKEIVARLRKLEIEKIGESIRIDIEEEERTLSELKKLEARIFYQPYNGEKVTTDVILKELSSKRQNTMIAHSFLFATVAYLLSFLLVSSIAAIIFRDIFISLNNEPDSFKSNIIILLVFTPPIVIAASVYGFAFQKFFRPVVKKLIDMEANRIDKLNDNLSKVLTELTRE
ncbi:MAG: toll/interleukin-1 receptor domain-containing protein [Chloroflexota bacterium]